MQILNLYNISTCCVSARRLLEFSSEKNIKPVIIKLLAEDSSKENQIEQSISQLQVSVLVTILCQCFYATDTKKLL